MALLCCSRHGGVSENGMGNGVVANGIFSGVSGEVVAIPVFSVASSRSCVRSPLYHDGSGVGAMAI